MVGVVYMELVNGRREPEMINGIRMQPNQITDGKMRNKHVLNTQQTLHIIT